MKEVELTFSTYAEHAAHTLKDSAKNLPYLSLGLCGEAGEVAEKVKKSIRDGAELNRSDMAKELGDVLWYVSSLADILGISLEEVALTNLQKLSSRQERGVISGSGDDR